MFVLLVSVATAWTVPLPSGMPAAQQRRLWHRRCITLEQNLLQPPRRIMNLRLRSSSLGPSDRSRVYFVFSSFYKVLALESSARALRRFVSGHNATIVQKVCSGGHIAICAIRSHCSAVSFEDDTNSKFIIQHSEMSLTNKLAES